jgi:hypothetical protein
MFEHRKRKKEEEEEENSLLIDTINTATTDLCRIA